MTVKDIITKNRTYRRFYQEIAIKQSVLEELIDLARLSSCGANLQSLKYLISNKSERNQLIFDHLKWAGYLTDWNGPEEGERPSAYIIMLGDKDISKNYFWDHGIAAQSILLGACEKGLGGCMFGSVDKEGLKGKLSIPDKFDVLMVIALGKPKEVVVLEEIDDGESIKYWRDENNVHHVPKRKLQDIILNL
jgi:nitroreductase